MKLSWRVELPQLLLIAGLFAVAAWAWPQVPDRIPIHWNVRGEADGFGGKFAGLLLMPLIIFGIYLLTAVLPLIDPGRRNYQNFATAYNAIRLAILLFMSAIYAVSLLAAFGRHVNMTTVVAPGMAVLFLVIGNFMGKIRPNWFVGVRTPWTLSSKLSWDKTHRLAGWLFVFMGALFVPLAFWPTVPMILAIVTIDVLCAIWIIAYSYVVYRHDPDRTSPAGTSPSVD
jgi:uncharacterized membrane protein